jgi:T4-like virus tail tube protein gp19
MAQNNATKVFNFAIEINGIDQFLIQDVKVPEVEIGAVEHGASNYNVKTAGGVATSDAELQKIVPAPGGDRWAWDWLMKAQDPNNETGGLTEDYYKDIVFKELSPSGATLNSDLWIGSWVRKVSKSNYKRGKQDENVIQTVTISVNRVKPIV